MMRMSWRGCLLREEIDSLAQYADHRVLLLLYQLQGVQVSIFRWRLNDIRAQDHQLCTALTLTLPFTLTLALTLTLTPTLTLSLLLQVSHLIC